MTTKIDFYTPFRNTGLVTSDGASELDDIANQLVADATRTGEEPRVTVAQLIQIIQTEINSLTPPKMTESRAEYWKAGARDVIHIVNKAIVKAQL